MTAGTTFDTFSPLSQWPFGNLSVRCTTTLKIIAKLTRGLDSLWEQPQPAHGAESFLRKGKGRVVAIHNPRMVVGSKVVVGST